MDLRTHLIRQIVFSRSTFGPGERREGVIDHIRKELQEIEAADTDKERIEEWVDVVILALDGLWRSIDAAHRNLGAAYVDVDEVAGHIEIAIVKKQRKNEARDWPDWRTTDPNKAIEHVRSSD
jgi:hypothetical protein